MRTIKIVVRPRLFGIAAASLVCLAVWLARGDAWAMEITSGAFAPSGSIPVEYTCDGRDVSPPLAWSASPDGTKAFALIVDDPDAPAGTWVHWVIYDIPATAKTLNASVPTSSALEDGSRQGINDFRKMGYAGPCPPRGAAHRYFFKLYALDAATNLPPSATKAQLLKATQGHVLGHAELVGTYRRR